MAARNPSSLRLLILRVGAMGDILHGLPAVWALRERLPDAFIGWAVAPRWQALLAAETPMPGQPRPLVDRIHPVPTRDWKQHPFSMATLRQIATLRRGMHAERYDVCVDLQGSIRSAAIGRMSGAERLLGPSRPRERQARALYGERVSTAARHVIDQACELLSAALPGGRPLRPAPVRLPVDAAAERWCDDLLARVNRNGAPLVLLAPTAGWGAKQWPAAKFAALAQHVAGGGCRVLINASAAEDQTVAEIASASPAEPVVSTLAQLIALVRRASLVVGGDTGPMHMAAALGRPVVALYGPTDPARNGPAFPGADALILRHASSVLSPRRHGATEAGLARMTVDQVAGAALTQLHAMRKNTCT